jgi:hypothetical protein
MKPLPAIALSFAACAFFSACATEPRSVETPSGKPEVTINAKVSDIKAAILGEMVDVGYTVTKDSDFSLELTRPANGAEEFAASLTIGNAYSSNRRIADFTFIPTEGAVRVIASCRLESQMPGGQVNSAQITDNKTFNVYEAMFAKIKARLETQKSGAR